MNLQTDQLNQKQQQNLLGALDKHLKICGGVDGLIKSLTKLHNDYVIIIIDNTEYINPGTSGNLIDLQETINILKSAIQD